MCSEPNANVTFICSVKIKVLAVKLIQICHDFASCFTSDVQAFAHRIPMKYKIQSVFLTNFAGFCEAEYCDNREQIPKLLGLWLV